MTAYQPSNFNPIADHAHTIDILRFNSYRSSALSDCELVCLDREVAAATGAEERSERTSADMSDDNDDISFSNPRLIER